MRQTVETELVERLKHASRFLDAVAIVCDRARMLGVVGAAVLLLGEDGPPVVAVDDHPDLGDTDRLYMVSPDHWLESPVFAAMRRKMSVVEQPSRELVVPLIDPKGWFGVVTFTLTAPADRALERELTILGTTLSVWCTDHGVGVVPRDARRELALRQVQIARLAAAGHTNPEIAKTLDISLNTVKLRLKQVFERLRVDNRTELANMLRRLAALDGIPESISRGGELVVTRVARR